MFRFIDPVLQQRFEEDGYVKLRLLTEEQADALYQFYLSRLEQHQVVKSLYHSTTDTENAELIDEVDKQLSTTLLPEVSKHIADYQLMISGFLLKDPGPGSETGIHQDPTFVDESQYISANIWVGLSDIGHDNGNMFFIKGTHRMMPSFRVTPSCPTVFDNVKDLLPDFITEVPVKKGEAIVINHALVHGATANISNKPRVVATMAIRSAGSDWIFHYKEKDAPNDRIEKYRFTRESMMHMPKDSRPVGSEFLGYISHDFKQISREDFLRFMGAKPESRGPLSFFRSLLKPARV